ncbi:MAG: hypothetical protein HYV63_20485 [Candidatus Schekmanbacteria bacterium]|nr:hypothetical protein [Candidatus Schekmanbacteria bacterium]
MPAIASDAAAAQPAPARRRARQRPFGVTLIGVLDYVEGLVLILGGLIIGVLSFDYATLRNDVPLPAEDSLVASFAITTAGIGVLLIMLGRATLQGRNGARHLQVILNLILLITVVHSPVSILVVFYLLVSREAEDYFRGR